MIVLFLGVDGSGKTTLINRLEEDLSAKVYRLYLGMGKDGWKINSIKKYGVLCSKSKIAQRLGLNLIYLYILLPFELLLRKSSIKQAHRSDSITLVDRFPGFPFINGGCLAKIYKRILPIPDIIYLLEGDKEIIAERKPEEINPEKVSREIYKWREVAKNLNIITITLDTSSLSVEDCIKEIKHKLWDRL